MTCPITKLEATRVPLDFGNFERLHRDGRDLINGWLARAAAEEQGDAFESFIYLWIAFNGWAACVSGHDSDRAWLNALNADPTLNAAFAELVAQETQTAVATRRFSELWPIFRVAELRRLGVAWPSPEERGDAVRTYFGAGAQLFEPACFRDHAAVPEEVPIDWGHTLNVLYRVRSNLFHGEKARDSENDQQVVSAALATLLAFVGEARLFEIG